MTRPRGDGAGIEVGATGIRAVRLAADTPGRVVSAVDERVFRPDLQGTIDALVRVATRLSLTPDDEVTIASFAEGDRIIGWDATGWSVPDLAARSPRPGTDGANRWIVDAGPRRWQLDVRGDAGARRRHPRRGGRRWPRPCALRALAVGARPPRDLRAAAVVAGGSGGCDLVRAVRRRAADPRRAGHCAAPDRAGRGRGAGAGGRASLVRGPPRPRAGARRAAAPRSAPSGRFASPCDGGTVAVGGSVPGVSRLRRAIDRPPMRRPRRRLVRGRTRRTSADVAAAPRDAGRAAPPALAGGAGQRRSSDGALAAPLATPRQRSAGLSAAGPARP